MLIAIYALTSVLVRSDDAVNDLVAVTFIAATVLALENVFRWFFILNRIVADDLAYDHVDSVVLVFAVMVCLGVLTFGGRRWQRRYALVLLPLLIVCMEIMKRRAAFAILAVGIVAFLIFFVRLRPRLFWKVVPPLAVLCTIYLAVYWNGNGSLAQPARAIRSQIAPDPRDLASDMYRLLEKYDIVLNIRQAPLTGLGFGRPYTFYIPLPDLSQGWPFWHYISHDAILWVWMKDGAIGFIVFWWLLGRGAYDGSRAVETQREEWDITSRLHAMLAGGGPRGAKATAFERRLAQYASALLKPSAKLGRRRRAAPTDTLGLNVPTWDRTDKFRSVTARRSGALAFVVACVCLIPIQVTYSYVDLGLISERDMLLLGLVLGVIAHAKPLLGVQESRQKRRKSPARPAAPRRRSREPVLTPAESVERAQELVLRGRARTGAGSRPLNSSRPLFPTQPTAQGVTALARLEPPSRPWRNTRPPASPSPSASPSLPPHDASAEEDTTPRVRTITPPLSESPLPWERT
jgi:hypothetical protein